MTDYLKKLLTETAYYFDAGGYPKKCMCCGRDANNACIYIVHTDRKEHGRVFHYETTFDMLAVCEHCYKRDIVRKCTRCGHVHFKNIMQEMARTSGGSSSRPMLCATCYGHSNWCRCSVCNDQIYSGGSRVYSDSNTSHTHCTGCAEDRANADEITYCNVHHRYETFDFHEAFCNTPEAYAQQHETNITGLFHHNYKPKIKKTCLGKKDHGKVHMGIELEVEVGRLISRADVVSEVNSIMQSYAYIKTDGSLNNGIEIVSQPATVDAHLNVIPWRAVLEFLAKSGCKSHDTTTCGLHIHLDRDYFRKTQSDMISSIKFNYMMFGQFSESLLTAISRRKMGNYCAGRCLPSGSELKDRRMMNEFFLAPSTRYLAFNTLNKPTFELRHFKGTLKPNTFFGTLEYADALSKYVARENIARCQGNKDSWIHWHYQYAKDSTYKYLPQMIGRTRINLAKPVEVQAVA